MQAWRARRRASERFGPSSKGRIGVEITSRRGNPFGPWVEGASFRTRTLGLAVACGLAGAICFAVDLPVAVWAATQPLPRELKRLLDLSEIFAHTTGVVALLAALAVIDPSRAWSWRASMSPDDTDFVTRPRAPFPRMIAATFTGGLVVDLIKLSVLRVRPRALDMAAASSAIDTFDRAAAALPQPGHGDLMSFPSGHAAVAAGFATMLAWRYPQGSAVFAVFAALAAAQRVFSSAHYPSDVCFGAAIGIAGAALLLGGRPQAPA